MMPGNRRKGGASMEPRPCERGNGEDWYVELSIGLASMEPRPCERGNMCAQGAAHATGASFNGATSLRTWKRSAKISKVRSKRELQWSHVLANVETGPRLRLCFSAGQASMEPRPCERGNCPRKGRALIATLPASMEPRPCERGNGYEEFPFFVP